METLHIIRTVSSNTFLYMGGKRHVMSIYYLDTSTHRNTWKPKSYHCRRPVKNIYLSKKWWNNKLSDGSSTGSWTSSKSSMSTMISLLHVHKFIHKIISSDSCPKSTQFPFSTVTQLLWFELKHIPKFHMLKAWSLPTGIIGKWWKF